MAEITIAAFEIDERNRLHFTSHGIDDALIYEVWLGTAHYRENPPPPEGSRARSGTHLMIGPSADGRIWTIVIVEVDPPHHVWRPITGWPSTRREQRHWEQSQPA